MFASYSLTKRLGQTSQSDTYLASPMSQPELEVVIKIFHTSCLGPGYEARDFLRDVTRLQQLVHPHLLPILDADVEQQQPFVVSPYLARGSLRDHLRTCTPPRLSLALALQLGIEIGQGLSYCHDHDFLHGHILPDNVLFADDGTAQLGDFGLASLTADNPVSPHAVCYCAPEWLTDLGDQKSDQFALGCLLYEMITGSLPFEQSEPAIALHDPQAKLPLTPSQLVTDVPEELDAVLLKALASEPAARYENVALLVHALQAISVAAATTPTTPSQARPDDKQADAHESSLDASSNPRSSKAPAFPFSSEASVSYRDILSSLQLEESKSSISSHTEEQLAVDSSPPTNKSQPAAEEDLSFYLWDDQDDANLMGAREEDDTEEQALSALSVSPALDTDQSEPDATEFLRSVLAQSSTGSE